MAAVTNDSAFKYSSTAGAIYARAEADNELKKITIKTPEQLDFRIEEWPLQKLNDYILVLQDLSAKAAADFV